VNPSIMRPNEVSRIPRLNAAERASISQARLLLRSRGQQLGVHSVPLSRFYGAQRSQVARPIASDITLLILTPTSFSCSVSKGLLVDRAFLDDSGRVNWVCIRNGINA